MRLLARPVERDDNATRDQRQHDAERENARRRAATVLPPYLDATNRAGEVTLAQLAEA